MPNASADEPINLAEQRILEDLIDHHISPAAILKRRHRTHIDGLVKRGLVKHTAAGIELDDEVAALIALGRTRPATRKD